MGIRRLIVIGSSAGGVEALITLVSALPKHFATPICIAQHLPPLKESRLPVILTRLERLPASHPPDGARLVGGTIFVAPPGYHVFVSGEQIVVTPALGERSCPSVDRLFTSAASSYGSGLIGVILTGLLSDGTVGLQAVKHAGGITIIQDPSVGSLLFHAPVGPRPLRHRLLPGPCPDLSALASLDGVTTRKIGGR